MQRITGGGAEIGEGSGGGRRVCGCVPCEGAAMRAGVRERAGDRLGHGEDDDRSRAGGVPRLLRVQRFGLACASANKEGGAGSGTMRRRERERIQSGAKREEPRRLLQLHNKIQNSSEHREHEDGMDLATTPAIESRWKRAGLDLGIPSIPVT